MEWKRESKESKRGKNWKKEKPGGGEIGSRKSQDWERERDDGLPDGDFLLPSSPWTSNERQKQNESEEGSKRIQEETEETAGHLSPSIYHSVGFLISWKLSLIIYTSLGRPQ